MSGILNFSFKNLAQNSELSKTLFPLVIPAKAGIQRHSNAIKAGDTGFLLPQG